MWLPPLTTAETAAIAIVLSVSAAVLYRLALPKPLPGIPYNENAARSILGDLPEVAKFQKETRLFWIWLTQLAERLQAPIAQVFLRPLGKPYVIVTDYREAHDILVHRHKEFDRADFFRDTMGPLTPDAHILFKTDDNFRLHRKVIGDLMSPAFLQNVAAPSLYTNLCKHIALWDAKSRLAQGHPFEAIDDIYYSAFDAVTSFTFSDNFTHNATKSRVSFYKSMPTDKINLPTGKDEAVVFPKSPIVDEFVEAFRELALVYEEVLASMWPRMQWYFILRRPRVRHAVQVKESVFHREIEEGIQRLDGGKNESRVKSAMDHMLFREATIASKEERNPDFHRRTIYDEVSSPHATSARLLFQILIRLCSSSPLSPLGMTQVQPRCAGASNTWQTTHTRKKRLGVSCSHLFTKPEPRSAGQMSVKFFVLLCHISTLW